MCLYVVCMRLYVFVYVLDVCVMLLCMFALMCVRCACVVCTRCVCLFNVLCMR